MDMERVIGRDMQDIEIAEEEIELIRQRFDLLKAEKGGKLELSQVEMRDDLIKARLDEIDQIHNEIKARKV
jgi:hypothetical protein